jgi:O-acetylhomoserine/O-acetylserine sulfhydrylase-like pyridoxal-dependent enzyme
MIRGPIWLTSQDMWRAVTALSSKDIWQRRLLLDGFWESSGGFPSAVTFCDALKLIRPLVHLEGAMALLCHPASIPHRQKSMGNERAAVASPEMIGLGNGIGQADDIIADLAPNLDIAT